ncbi:MAG: integron integrase [Nitrospiraceae bacterium]|nr:MAG: integron integrase [Nitrospiraceae bacterium]
MGKDQQSPSDARLKNYLAFWKNYRAEVLRQGIPDSLAPWFEHWARQFSLSVPKKNLRDRSAKDIRQFLDMLRSNSRVDKRQVKQAYDALKILYRDYLKLPWDLSEAEEKTHRSSEKAVLQTARPVPPPVSAEQVPQKPPPPEPGPRDTVASVKDIYSKLLSDLERHHYSRRTEQLYNHWVRRFINFHGISSPQECTADAVRTFLEHLAKERNVALTTQKQARNALVFFFEEVLDEPLSAVGDITQATEPVKQPDILTRDEITRLLSTLSGEKLLIIGLLYESGLRLLESLRLRVHDLDFSEQQIAVRNAKGRQVRTAHLPQHYIQPFEEHLEQVKEQHSTDLSHGLGAVYLWPAFLKKNPDSSREWIWQYVFPAHRLSIDPVRKKIQRHHVHESAIHKALRDAAQKAAIKKKVSCHVLRLTSAVHNVESGSDMRALQIRFGISDAMMTFIQDHMKKSRDKMT